jgi:tetratricopeptide (TPR) repeat protein
MADTIPGDELFKEGYEWYHFGGPAEQKKAFPLLQQAAAQGHPEAIYYLGKMFRHGEGIPRNYDEALRLFRSIPDHPLARYELAIMYFCGRGVKQDYAEAKEYFEQIVARYSKDPSKVEAEAVAKSISCLSQLYQRGLGVPKDHKKAIEVYLSGYTYAQMANESAYFFDFKDLIDACGSRKVVGYFANLITQIENLQQKVSTLERDNQSLKTELDYRPDGSGYHQARDDFYSFVDRSTQS